MFAPGQASNNKDELAALWVVPRLALDKKLKSLQLYGVQNGYRLGKWENADQGSTPPTSSESH